MKGGGLRSILLRAALLLLALMLPRLTWAQSARGTEAEALFREGKRLLEAKDFDRACPKLAESYRLDPATGALLALAICQEGAGKVASAWASYAEVAARSKNEGRADREKAARRKVTALEPKLSMLTITVPEAAEVPGLRVERDGEEMAHATWGVAVPVDPGEHRIDVSAPGRRAWHQTIALGRPGEHKGIEVPVLALVPEPKAEPPVPRVVPPAPPASPVARIEAPDSSALVKTSDRKADLDGDQSEHRRMTAGEVTGIVVGAAGLITLGGAGYFTLRALNRKHAYEALGAACSSDCQELRDARDAGNIATILSIGGGVLTTAGIITYLLSGRSSGGGSASATGVGKKLRVSPVYVAGSWQLVFDGDF